MAGVPEVPVFHRTIGRFPELIAQFALAGRVPKAESGAAVPVNEPLAAGTTEDWALHRTMAIPLGRITNQEPGDIADGPTPVHRPLTPNPRPVNGIELCLGYESVIGILCARGRESQGDHGAVEVHGGEVDLVPAVRGFSHRVCAGTKSRAVDRALSCDREPGRGRARRVEHRERKRIQYRVLLHRKGSSH